MTLSEVIQTDDLHWNEEEKRFVALSVKELDKIVEACVLSGIDDMDRIEKMVRWSESIRTGDLLLKGVLNGRLGIIFKDDDEPSFCAIEEPGELEEF